MTLTRALPTQHASGLPLIDERRIVAGMFARNTDGTARTGVLPAHANPLVTGRSSMGYDIAAFNAVTARTTAGAEQIANDGTVTVATGTAPAANSRVDVIWVRAQFQILGDANNDVVFGVTQGATNVSPVKPAIPAGAFELATATIPSTATTTLSSGVVIQNTFQYTAAVGGVVWMRTANEMNGWVAANGAQVFRLDLGEFYVRRAGAWEPENGDTGWLALTTGPGWNPVAGHTPRGKRLNGAIHTEGAVIRASGGLHTNIVTLPSALRIIASSKTTFIGPTVASRAGVGVSYQEMYTDVSGVIGVSGYTSMDGTIDWVFPVTATFVQDQR